MNKIKCEVPTDGLTWVQARETIVQRVQRQYEGRDGRTNCLGTLPLNQLGD